MKIIFISDIHGQIENLKKISFDCDKLVVLGDLFGFSYEDNDFVAYTIGHKVISGHNVYVVAVRGTTGNEEWISNFHLGTGDYHYGFNHAAGEITGDLLCQRFVAA